MDIEIRFTAAAPLDPIEPLKNVTYTEDCNGFICDLTDIQIIPGWFDFLPEYSTWNFHSNEALTLKNVITLSNKNTMSL